MAFAQRFAVIEPVVVPSCHGRYLAVSGSREPIRIAVIGLDESDARDKFQAEAKAWGELLDEPHTEAR